MSPILWIITLCCVLPVSFATGAYVLATSKLPVTAPPRASAKSRHSGKGRLRALDPLNWFFPVKADHGLFSLEQRREAASRLRTAITDDTVSSLLLDVMMKGVEVKSNALRTVEQKAASAIGFAGTIIAIYAAFGRHDLLAWVVVPLTFSIACNLRAMLVERYQLPSPILYNTKTVLNDKDNKARVEAALTESYGQYSVDLGVSTGLKSRYVIAGTILLLIGLAAMVIPATLTKPTESLPTTINCTQPKCVVVLTKDPNNGR